MEATLAFLALLLPLTLSPGPTTITLAGLGMSNGVAKSLPFYFGLQVSTFAIATVSGFGLHEILLSNAIVYDTIRYAGIAYIVYLAVKFLRAQPSFSESTPSAHGVYDGMLLTALNPKFYVMIAVVFSQFLKPGQNIVWMLIFGLCAVIAGSSFAWLTAGASLRPLLRSRKALRVQAVTFGVLLLAVAGFMLVRG